MSNTVSLLSVVLAFVAAWMPLHASALPLHPMDAHAADAAPAAGAPPRLSSRQQQPQSLPSFFVPFTLRSYITDMWSTSGYWANGYPFASGWDPSFYTLDQTNGLTLLMKRQNFSWTSADGTTTIYPFTSAELRSINFYGYGCYSTCMKAASGSGVSSSFFIFNGPRDTPPGTAHSIDDHNEIDIEFVGYDTTKVQSNFFSRSDIPGGNSGSGNEILHQLWFDAATQFAVYTFKWTEGRIDWYVNGNYLRTSLNNSVHPVPSAEYSTVRVMANVWVVDEKTQEWGEIVSPNLQNASASYRWMRFDQGQDCVIPSQC